MLSLKNIVKNYKMGDTEVKALKGVSIDFRENEFVSILGQSGCGKTTLLNIIGGLDRYDSGDLIIGGVSTKKYKDRDWDTYRNHKIGFIFQSYNLIPHQTVLANVELALTLSGVSKAERRRRAVEVLEKVGLGDQLKKKPNQMSGGQMQRVAIARALINDPDILLADEPTGALDSETSIQIMDILREISKDKLIIMVTHNPELAEQYSNRIIRLVDGKIVDDSNPFTNDEELKNAPEKVRKTSMSFFTALSLSLNNLMTKKGRTILTAFAGSIGIIGIALILSLSNGVQEYIDDIQTETMSSYPLSIETNTTDMTAFMSSSMTSHINNITKERDYNKIYTNNRLGDMFTMMYQETNVNDLKSFKAFIESEESGIKDNTTNIEYSYGITLQVFADDTENIMQVNPSNVMNEIGFGAVSGMMDLASMMKSSSAGTTNIFQELTESEEMFNTKYELVAGEIPDNYDEAVLIVDKYNEITDYTLYTLGLQDIDELRDAVRDMMQKKEGVDAIEGGKKEYSFDEILDLTFRVVDNTAFYEKDENGVWIDKRDDAEFMADVLEESLQLKIVGIIRMKEESASSISGTIGYKKGLMEYISGRVNDSEIVKEQQEKQDYDVFTGLPFDGTEAGDEAIAKAEKEAEERQKEAEELMAQMKEMQEQMAQSGLDISALSPEEQAMLAQMTPEEQQAYILANSPSAELANPSMLTEEQQAMLAQMTPEEQAAFMSSLQVAPPDTAVAVNPDGATEPTVDMTEMPEFDMSSMDMGGMDLSQLTDEQMAYFASMTEEEQQEMMKLYTDAILKAAVVSDSTYYDNMTTMGVIDLEKPASILIYPIDFEAKENITQIISDYNTRMEENGEENKVISYTDMVGMLMSSVTDIIDAISYILIAFVAISLIVSSIMIGIITYISVLERTKEIGILRAIGASKKDISRVFNAETVIVGLVSGCIGIGVTVLLNIPINIIIENITDIAGLSVLPPAAGIILIAISVLLTLIAGLFPSGVAAKKDPVVALRSE
ncbi:MAG: ATP-binding cassette domain-containing protein [Ruminiclostridium sp.]|nr:ATP-binding cassette domain-containing protein [Ruminiclostridium sp.]